MHRRRRGILFWLTNRFTYAQKYVIAGLVRGIGFFIFWFSLLFLIINQVSLIKAQLSSNRLQAPLRKIYESVILHEIDSERIQGGAAGLENNLEKYETTISEQLGVLSREGADEVFSEDEDANYVTFKLVKEKWSEIGNQDTSSPEAYQSLIRDVRILMEENTDNVILTKDPINVSYLLLENIKRRLRDSQSYIWQAVTISEKAQNQNEIDSTDREQLRIISQYLQRSSESTFEELKKIKSQLESYDDFADIGRRLRVSVNQYRISVEEFVLLIEEGFLEPENQLTPEYMTIDGTLLLGSTIALGGLTTKQLDLILEQRKLELWTGMFIVFILGIFFTFLGSYIGVHFVYEAIQAFHALDVGTRKLTSGDLSVRVPIVYTEEIGKATMAFNRMADHLEKLINQQRNLFEATSKLAEGNFSVRVQVDENSDEEIIQVSNSFNIMAQTFEEIVRQLHRLGVNLTSSANEIALTSKKQQQLIVEQGEATREISITASEISTTAKDFAITINDVSIVAEQSSSLASDGQDSLIEMEKIMRQMVGASSNIAEKLDILNEKASLITKIITTITNVARQTNLLSLNAAIEAEKTGMFSRDFSVIAREIRRLADQTALATLDIENIVNEIMNAVSSCVSGVEDFTKKIQFGVDQVVVVGEQLGQIIVQVQALAYRFETVNEGMQSQSGSAEKINEAMVKLSHSASATTESISRFSETIDNLSGASQDLRQTIENISVSDKKPSLLNIPK
ncbi:MAG: Methyl-accepting chemotaxis protein 4 [Chlamydiae bacterium]|nr:Methyl-accepting chemotaxis protein 4 [Chlamydiota bacterium]